MNWIDKISKHLLAIHNIITDRNDTMEDVIERQFEAINRRDCWPFVEEREIPNEGENVLSQEEIEALLKPYFPEEEKDDIK